MTSRTPGRVPLPFSLRVLRIPNGIGVRSYRDCDADFNCRPDRGTRSLPRISCSGVASVLSWMNSRLATTASTTAENVAASFALRWRPRCSRSVMSCVTTSARRRAAVPSRVRRHGVNDDRPGDSLSGSKWTMVERWTSCCMRRGRAPKSGEPYGYHIWPRVT